MICTSRLKSGSAIIFSRRIALRTRNIGCKEPAAPCGQHDIFAGRGHEIEQFGALMTKRSLE